MRSIQKISLSLLVAVIIFTAFALFAFSGLFEVIESSFYSPRVLNQYQSLLQEAGEDIEDYHESNLERFQSIIRQDEIRTVFSANQSQSDIEARERIFSQLADEQSGFGFMRVINRDAERLHFSTFPDDYETSGNERTYLPVEDLDEDFAELVLEEDQAADVFVEAANNRLIYRLPVDDENGIRRGTALFYYSPRSLANRLTADGLIESGRDAIPVGTSGFLLNVPRGSADGLRSAVEGTWESIEPGSAGRVSGDGEFVLPVQEHAGRRVGYLVPASELSLTGELKGILLTGAFLTVFLLSFLLLNIRQDSSVVLSERVKRFQIRMLKEYLERREDIDWETRRRELERRKPEMTRRIKRGIGKVRPEERAELDELVEKGWEEILDVIGSRRGQAAGSGIDMKQLESMLERFMSNLGDQTPRHGISAPSPQPGGNKQSNSGESTALAASDSGGDSEDTAAQAATLGGPSTLSSSSAMTADSVAKSAENEEELEELDDSDAIEVMEEVEDADSAEAPLELQAAEPAEGAEELEEVEAADGAEELEEVEAADGAEELEEVEAADEAEELEEVEPADAVPETHGFEEADAPEVVDDSHEAQRSALREGLDEQERQKPESTSFDPDTRAEADSGEEEIVEGLGEVEDLADVDELEELDAAEEVDEVGELEELDEPDEVGELEELDAAEEVDEVGELDTADEIGEREPSGEDLEDGEVVLGSDPTLAGEQSNNLRESEAAEAYGATVGPGGRNQDPAEAFMNVSIEDEIAAIFSEQEQHFSEAEASGESSTRANGSPAPSEPTVQIQGGVTFGTSDLKRIFGEPAIVSRGDGVLTIDESVYGEHRQGDLSGNGGELSNGGGIKAADQRVGPAADATTSTAGEDVLYLGEVALEPVSGGRKRKRETARKTGEALTEQGESSLSESQSEIVTSSGIDFDRFLRRFRSDDAGVVRALVFFTRRVNAKLAFILVTAGDGYRGEFSLGIEEGAVRKISVPAGSNFAEGILNKRCVFLFERPLAELPGLHFEVDERAFASFKRSLFLPVTFRRKQAYLVLGLQPGGDEAETLLRKIKTVLNEG